jgi:hypothetical protein
MLSLCGAYCYAYDAITSAGAAASLQEFLHDSHIATDGCKPFTLRTPMASMRLSIIQHLSGGIFGSQRSEDALVKLVMRCRALTGAGTRLGRHWDVSIDERARCVSQRHLQ